jgi:AP-1-like transcription factor
MLAYSERNVALQKVAKRLKDENDQLRLENAALREQFAALEAERKRKPDDDLRSTPAKRFRIAGTAHDTLPLPGQTHMAEFSLPSPLSTAASPHEHEQSCSPAPQEVASVSSRSSSYDGFFDFTPSHTRAASLPSTSLTPRSAAPTSTAAHSGYGIDQFDCGFCDEQTPCVCREIALQSSQTEGLADAPLATQAAPVPAPAPRTLKLEPVEQLTGGLFSTVNVPGTSSSTRTSILDQIDKLPYQPAVPLRRRAPTGKTAYNIFPVSPTNNNADKREGCSGDPSNCPACADDSFGQAFCSAIRDSVANAPVCTGCPGGCSAASSSTASSALVGGTFNAPATTSHARSRSDSRCCGNPLLCGHAPASAFISGISGIGSSTPSSLSKAPEPTIPTDSAWRTLKQHPNAAFADLRLLAEVVARRSTCSGPVVIVDPPSRTSTPQQAESPSTSLVSSRRGEDNEDQDGQPVLLTDPHSRPATLRELSPTSCGGRPVHCGRRRIREVPYDAVRDAIRILDASFPSS